MDVKLKIKLTDSLIYNETTVKLLGRLSFESHLNIVNKKLVTNYLP